MQIYLDANATTPVLAQAGAAALSAMTGDFGNPSSIHQSGLKARALLDQVRATARRVLQVPQGGLIFTSGATEGIQTAVLSALADLKQRRDAGGPIPSLLLYGATEHKAVPESLRHWSAVLGLNLAIECIPVGANGRHDLAWLQARIADAGLVCTMAVNNETGVISDLDGIAAIVQGSQALWLVDGVQGLGKIDLRLRERRIDYAPFSGHKVFAPKGIGMLYVREGAPFTPLVVGGGQEGALRSGTENMAGIAALGAVLDAMESGDVFAAHARLVGYREQLADALREAFPGVVFNAPLELAVPTTLNVSVPGLASSAVLDLFDAAAVRASGGSACGASKPQPSEVLKAMGLPDGRAASAVRISFSALDSPAVIAEACQRLRKCGEALRATCALQGAGAWVTPLDPLTRFMVDGAVCYVLADATSRQCIVVDPLRELTDRLSRWLRCRGCQVVAVLDTHGHGDHASSAPALRAALGDRMAAGDVEPLGWPVGAVELVLGSLRVTRLPVPGHTQDSMVYVFGAGGRPQAAFVGDTVMPGALGRSDFPVSEPLAYGPSLAQLDAAIAAGTPLLPGHDYDHRFVTTLAVERRAQPLLDGVLSGRLSAADFAREKAVLERDLPPTEYQTMACGARVDCASRVERVEIAAGELARWRGRAQPLSPVLVDVREAYEERMSPVAGSRKWLPEHFAIEATPLSVLPLALQRWAALPEGTPVVFFCRSGNRSAQAARALRRLGHANAWSLAGGLALLDDLQALADTAAALH